jgi:hypothetical protein
VQRATRAVRVLLAAIVASSMTVAPVARAQEREVTVAQGIAPGGYSIAVAPRGGGEPRVLCEPECALALPRATELRLGVRRGGDIEWVRDVVLDGDLRLDVRLEDRSALRQLGYALLIATGALLLATAIVGVVTEPQAPDHGWFGGNHALVFAGIAGGIVLAFGAPGVGFALAFERDAPALDVVPVD